MKILFDYVYDQLVEIGERLVESFLELGEDLLPMVAWATMPIWIIPYLIIKRKKEREAAISWARSARPSWYAIYYRTKKKRIRKKYLDRIIREYRRNLEHGILEV